MDDLFIPGLEDISVAMPSASDDLTRMLLRPFQQEDTIGRRQVQVSRFSLTKNAERILADIEQKNAAQNMGNIPIPGTNIRLINFSLCPTCGRVFSFKDLAGYYRNPKADSLFKNRGEQLRLDTGVCCDECGSWFLPSLVISDGSPKNEVQFLCKMQTVEAVEGFFLRQNRYVLSKKRENIRQGPGFITIRNDVGIQELASKPALICNMIQYTPANMLPNFIDGTNVEKEDILFGKWRALHY
ncbi:MAG: hypothetical protein LBD55_05785 [Treponema sp.]|nr:hypothetical protein [Treponema sp.]